MGYTGERKNETLRIVLIRSVDQIIDHTRFNTFRIDGNYYYGKEEVDNELRILKSRIAEVISKAISNNK
ncbi:hypothetical protein [Flavobacterium yafengii]|uniref:Uncharacterized protein n=1 Tax=Flavobacterium yafengii TaxID=3041253 RepID=A0AAW6TJE8_9FLAO|nr:hypothetical protein [Flavobacterium yafengii]MDI5949004.1 hypothetical protein [Flavobacterium yafengii]